MDTKKEQGEKLRVLAMYLPQYHPIPENDEWWGKGFTEWTNVAKAKPQFRGHYQPKIPTELGFYDLRMPEIREEQAQLAKEAGIEGFVYWHYWFGNGKQLLERPFNEVLKSGHPDFPFALAWANHSWTNKTWKKDLSHRRENSVLLEQLYPGVEDYEAHFYSVLPAFKDHRYICVDGCPLFMIFMSERSELKAFIETWRCLAKKEGLKGIHFVALKLVGSMRENISPKESIDRLLNMGYDAVNTASYVMAELKCKRIKKYFQSVIEKLFGFELLTRFRQAEINKYLYLEEDKLEYVYPTLLPNWDRSARAGRNCSIYIDSTPAVFEKQIQQVKQLVKDKQPEHRIVILKSWNEWGEGNYVEPDIKYGRGYLDVLKRSINEL